MTISMLSAIKRANVMLRKAARTAGEPVLDVFTDTMHDAFCIAWRAIVRAKDWQDEWKGPGSYRFMVREIDDHGRVAIIVKV